MSEASEKKAHAYLAEGRVKVQEVTADRALVLVYGSGDEPYSVHFGNAAWYCGCPSRKPECAHVIAAKLVVPLRTEKSTTKLGTHTDPSLDELLGQTTVNTSGIV